MPFTSRPYWRSNPFARSLLMVRDSGRSSLPSNSPQAMLAKRALRTKPLDASRWRKELLAKRFTPSHAGGANLAHGTWCLFTMAGEAFCHALHLRPRWWSEPCARRFIPKLVGARMLLPRPFHLPTSIGRTFFPNLPAMPRVPSLEAVCTQATVRNGLFCYSLRAFHHIIAANSANRHSLFSKTLQPFHQKETPDGAGFLPVPRPVPGCPDYSPVFTSC